MSNFIVCLAHFCELHGPSTIICTQMTSSEDRAQQQLLSSSSRPQTCASCSLMLPSGAMNLVTKENGGDGAKCFVSTHYPSLQQRYAALTKLVMKSLSVETTTDISKPVFFGDAVNGYCVTKIFRAVDANARGSERKYSLMVASDSENDLLSQWNTITMYLSELIALIQKSVETAAEGASAEPLQKSASSNSVFDNERYLRRSMIKPRSLVELTGDRDLFVKFHLWALELLKDIS
ncbi:Piso0_002394 [Millerozyma farinosa CBS 7064]|uniref:Piso0_002394 protein n=1 Tax=Pichia sorbitophila (strain ATCC MYA-4447 / BCRC 22081 / CBS 7064 / NBRC 10061 / NRRL Y-12695) TaxID=559304 RepID=G8YEX9_PICSO|nr:Piso0_002394 [Millerozyma farinosa CBS 7064]